MLTKASKGNKALTLLLDFFLIIGGHKSFLWSTDAPALDFW